MKIVPTSHDLTYITADRVTDEMIVLGVIDGRAVLRRFDSNYAAYFVYIDEPNADTGYGPADSTKQLIDQQISVNHATLQAFPKHGIADALRWLADELDEQAATAAAGN